jgi:methylmalonyl-CoA/ethylmalonyl-CoA epimerase
MDGQTNSSSSSFGLGQIGQIAVPVSDLERAVPFYRDILGMRFLFQAPPGLAFFDCDGIRLLLDVPAKANFQNHSSIIYYTVPDIHSAYQTLLERGVIFDQRPEFVAKMTDHDLWMAFFRDPDDNVLALMCEVRA